MTQLSKPYPESLKVEAQELVDSITQDIANLFEPNEDFVADAMDISQHWNGQSQEITMLHKSNVSYRITVEVV